MTPQEVKAQIKSKNLKSFYIFTGTEGKVIDIYIDKIAKCRNLGVERVESISNIYYRFLNKSLVDAKYCYVLRDDKELLTQEKLWVSISNGIQGDNIIILVLTTVDKRGKFYKKFKDLIVEFDKLSDTLLTKYIKKEINLNDISCKKLIDICESDYNRILLEIDKIRQYQEVTQTDANQCLRILIDENAIYQPPKDAIFDFVDAVLKNKTALAYELLDNCRRVGESNIVILSVLYNNIKQVLQVQSCQSSDIAKTTGLTSWQIRCAKEKCGYYSIGDLVYFLKLIRKIEVGIKTGDIEESISVDYALVNILF